MRRGGSPGRVAGAGARTGAGSGSREHRQRLPAIILFMIVQRWIVTGLAGGFVKG
jgi:hypothetical protein